MHTHTLTLTPKKASANSNSNNIYNILQLDLTRLASAYGSALCNNLQRTKHFTIVIWIHGERALTVKYHIQLLMYECIFSCYYYYYCPWVFVWLYRRLLCFFFINEIVFVVIIIFFLCSFFSNVSVCLSLDCFRVFICRVIALKYWRAHTVTEWKRTVRAYCFPEGRVCSFFSIVSNTHERYLINTLIVSSFTIFCAYFSICWYVINTPHMNWTFSTMEFMNRWFFDSSILQEPLGFGIG